MPEDHPILLNDAERAVLSHWRARALQRHLIFLGISMFFLISSGILQLDVGSPLSLWRDPTAIAHWFFEQPSTFSIYSVYPLAVILWWAWGDAKFRRDLAEGLIHCKGTVSQFPTKSRRMRKKPTVQVVYLTPSDPEAPSVSKTKVPKPIVLRASLADGVRLPRFTCSDCAYFPKTKILYRAGSTIYDQRPVWGQFSFKRRERPKRRQPAAPPNVE